MDPVNSEEIHYYFDLFKSKSTKQLNNLPMFAWRAISSSILYPMTWLANQMIMTTTFLSTLKQADVITLHKKGNKDNPNNYRPISTLHNLSKVFERVILTRITKFIEKHIRPEC